MGEKVKSMDKNIDLSIITSCYREKDNLQALWEQLHPVIDSLNIAWEWILIDDGSPDETWEEIKKLSEKSQKIRGIRLTSNRGSHIALSAGIEHAQGNWITKIPADAQDPPELIVDEWNNKNDVDIVWGVRKQHPGKGLESFFSDLYHKMFRRVVMPHFPKEVVDGFLISRRTAQWMLQSPRHNASIFGRLLELDLPSRNVYFEKRKRKKGVSGWTLEKKIKLVLDSLVSFSCRPLRLICVIGLFLMLCGGVSTIVAGIFGDKSEIGFWKLILTVVPLLGGLQMFLTGFLGEYVWRVFNTTQGGSAYYIRDSIGKVEKQNYEK